MSLRYPLELSLKCFHIFLSSTRPFPQQVPSPKQCPILFTLILPAWPCHRIFLCFTSQTTQMNRRSQELARCRISCRSVGSVIDPSWACISSSVHGFRKGVPCMQNTTHHAHTNHLVQLYVYYKSVTSYEPPLNSCVTMTVCSNYCKKKLKEIE